MSQSRLIKSWLDKRHIKVPDDWLEACLEWLQEENQGSTLSTDQLTSMVYDQWLETDLHELQTSCLPTAMVQENKFMLQGVFCLQVDSLLDVSQPYYGQLQKVHGTENSNVHVTATQQTQPPWEVKSGRMLLLKLTDGSNNVQGMEYRPIPALRTSLLPGCKVRVKGRILCRKGVMFLKSENLEILGGEVDSLTEANTQDKLLQNALTGTNEGTRGNQRKEFTGSAPSKQGTVNQGRQSADSSLPNRSSAQANHAISQTHASSNRFVSRTDSQFPDDEMEDDDFLESLGMTDLEALDQEWEVDMEDTASSSSNQQWQKERSDNSANSTYVARLGSLPQQKQSTLAGRCQNKSDFGLQKTIQPTPQPSSQYQISVNRPAQLGGSSQLGKSTNQIQGLGSQKPHSQTSKSDAGTIADIEMEMDDLADLMNDDFPMDDDFGDSVFHPQITKKAKMTVSGTRNVSSKSYSDQTTVSKSNSDHGQSSASTKQVIQPSQKSCAQKTSLSKLTECSSSNSSSSIATGHRNSFTANSIASGSSPVAVDSDADLFTKLNNRNSTGQSREQSTIPNFKASSNNTNYNTITMPDLSQFNGPAELQRHLVDVSGGNENKHLCSAVADEPFVYISSVLPHIQRKKQISFKVKAYVATLLSRLDSGQGQGWSLTCRINDGTGTLDVNLSDNVLAALIGFSAKDSITIKKGLMGDKSVLAEGIKECQLKLINVSCIFCLENKPFFDRPEVTAITSITKEHLEKLYARVHQRMSIRH